MTTPAPALRFIRRGHPVVLHGVAPDRLLLDLLREDLASTGTKEGCGEGGCGACTVVLGEQRGGALHYSAVNSCIRLAHSIAAMALWTVEDLAVDPLLQAVDDGAAAQPAGGAAGAAPAPDRALAAASALHPVQRALIDCHGAQCGFCTPGFVMSLFALYQNQVRRGLPVDRALAQQALSGNLCRCTGYRPILAAAQRMAALPAVAVNETALLEKIEELGQAAAAHPADSSSSYLAPVTLAALLAARAAHPDALLVAGGTDAALPISKRQQQHPRLIDLRG